MLRTEYEFILPCGYIDERGTLHRHGIMRMAMAMDEVEPLQDPRVKANQAYLGILLLSRVVIRLGDMAPVSPRVIERLFTADYDYLQDLYIRVNEAGGDLVETQCPTCATRFTLDLSG